MLVHWMLTVLCSVVVVFEPEDRKIALSLSSADKLSYLRP